MQKIPVLELIPPEEHLIRQNDGTSLADRHPLLTAENMNASVVASLQQFQLTPWWMFAELALAESDPQLSNQHLARAHDLVERRLQKAKSFDALTTRVLQVSLPLFEARQARKMRGTPLNTEVIKRHSQDMSQLACDMFNRLQKERTPRYRRPLANRCHSATLNAVINRAIDPDFVAMPASIREHAQQPTHNTSRKQFGHSNVVIVPDGKICLASFDHFGSLDASIMRFGVAFRELLKQSGHPPHYLGAVATMLTLDAAGNLPPQEVY
jgi:hypothetical protein